MTPKRVLMVAAHFAPENVSGTHRPLHFARSLADAGVAVDVVTLPAELAQYVDPSLLEIFPFPEAVHRIGSAASLGELYLRATRRTAAQPEPSTLTAAAPRRGTVRRLLASLDVFPDRFASWRRPATRAAVRVGRTHGADVVIASGPPWTALRVGAAAAARLGVPFIADFRDPWTPLTGAFREPEFAMLRRLGRRWERQVVHQAEVLLFNSPGVAEAAAESYPDGGRRPSRVIVNGADMGRRESPAPIPAAAPVRFRHFGTLYQGRSLDPLIEAIGASNAETGTPVDLELFGLSEWPVPDQLPAGVAIRVCGTLPHRDAVSRMAEPAVLVLVQSPNFDRQIPTKLFEYLFTGNPVLVVANRTSAAWALARDYSRCRLFDLGADPTSNGAVIADLVRMWRGGELCQERTMEDTASLTKAAVGAQFVSLVREVAAG